tara:strand:+ start:56 stop:460 length:405 start_codon:yes stop_codon:yes gene_type:complete
MKFLKYLILGFVLSILPACTTAQEVKESEVTWSKGDKVATFYICKTEKDIMDIALADTKGKEALHHIVLKKAFSKDCLNLNSPLGFVVRKIIGSYVDSDKKKTSILAISIPSEKKVAGYIVATGSPLSLKDNSL